VRHRLPLLLGLVALSLSTSASASQTAQSDPIGDMLMGVVTGTLPGTAVFQLRASLYHAGARGVGVMDSLGCRVVAMRTAAIDIRTIPKHSILFIKETVGLVLPDGTQHDGYWYASDTGGAIKGNRIDLFTGMNAKSMSPLRGVDLNSVSVTKVGEFTGCPPK